MVNNKGVNQMENEKQVWDALLDSQEGIDVFAELMEQAKVEVEQGKSEVDE